VPVNFLVSMSLSKLVRAVATALILLPIIGIGGCFAYRAYQLRRFAHLEQNTREVTTPEELQRWALRLISDSHSYTNSEQFRSIRTNYPSQLRRLVPGLTPHVNINEANSGAAAIWRTQAKRDNEGQYDYE
jgi:hypothetical protein